MTVLWRPPAVAPPSAVAPARRLIALVVGFGVLIGLALAAYEVFFVWHMHQGIMRTIARVVPLPVIMIDNRVVWYRELSERANVLETTAGLEPEDAFDQARVLAEQRAMLRSLAAKFDVDIPVRDAREYLEANPDLARSFAEEGWRQRDLLRFVIQPLLLGQKLEPLVLADTDLQSEARLRAEKIVEKIDAGVRFADLAIHYSEGSTATGGGSLGAIELTSLPLFWQPTIRGVTLGETTPVLEGDDAFWIFYIAGEVITAEGVETRLLSAIEIKKDLLGTIVARQVATARVRTLLAD